MFPTITQPTGTDARGPARKTVVALLYRMGAGPLKREKGQRARILHALIEAGARGVTAADFGSTRTAAVIHKLREAGLPIATENERHGGPFAGTHARYHLTKAVALIDAVLK